MFNFFRRPPNLPQICSDATALRRQLEQQLGQVKTVEANTKLAAFAARLHARRHHFRKHGLVLAFRPTGSHPAIYLLRPDHSAWASIWWCGDGFLLWAHRASSIDDDYQTYKVMDVTLTADLDAAERCLLHLLDSNRLFLGNYFLPADLIPLDRVPVPTLPPVPSLPPPTIDLTAVEVAPAARPVALIPKRLPPR